MKSIIITVQAIRKTNFKSRKFNGRLNTSWKSALKIALAIDFWAADLSASELRAFTEACSEVFANVIEHEYYCGSYSSKEQPKLKELLGAMATSVRKVEERVETAKLAGETFDNLTMAAKNCTIWWVLPIAVVTRDTQKF